MTALTRLVFTFSLAAAVIVGGDVALADPYVDPSEIPCYGGAMCDGAGPGFGAPPNPWDPTGGTFPAWGNLLQEGFNTVWDAVTNELPIIMYGLGCAWDC